MDPSDCTGSPAVGEALFQASGLGLEAKKTLHHVRLNTGKQQIEDRPPAGDRFGSQELLRQALVPW